MKIEITESNASRYFRCADRAAKMIATGYKVKAFTGDATAFFVTSPSGAMYLTYTELADNAVRCTCPDFEKNGDFCKHLLLCEEVKNEAEKWEAICAEVDARAAYELA